MPFVRHLDNVRPVIESVSIKKIEDRNPEWNPDLEPGPFIFCSLPCNYTTTKTQSKTFNVNSTWASTSFSLSSRPHVSGCFFFLENEVWPTVHKYPVKKSKVTKNASFQKRFPEWRLKTPASRLRVDGRKLRFSNMMMSPIIENYENYENCACSVRDAIVFPSF